MYAYCHILKAGERLIPWIKNLVRKGLVGSLFVAAAPVGAIDLSEVYELAVEHDPVLQAAAAERLAALEADPQSRALLLPSLSFSANVERDRQDIITFEEFSNREGTSTFDSRNYVLSLSQPVYRRDYFAQLRQADATVGQAEARFKAAEQALIVRVAERYFAVLSARDSLEFAQAEKESIERQLEQTKQRFEVGLIAITDVHEAQAAFDLATAREIAARNELSSAREAMREVIGRQIERVAPLMDPIALSVPEPANIERWADTALQQNFDLLAAEFATEVARAEVSRQRSGHYPTLDLNASYARSEADGGSFGEREQDDGVIGLQLNVPLYEGGAVVSRTREAVHSLSRARHELEQVRRSTLRQARDAYLAVVAQINQVKALGQARVSAQSALDATEAGFEVGTRTTVDVLDARRELFLARRDYAGARYDYILDTLRLKQASGVLGRSDLEQINQWIEPES